MSKISYEMANKDNLPVVYNWLLKENGGLFTCLMSMRRHKQISDVIVGMILEIARFNITDLLTV